MLTKKKKLIFVMPRLCV